MYSYTRLLTIKQVISPVNEVISLIKKVVTNQSTDFILSKNDSLILTLQRQDSVHGSSLMLPIRLQLQRRQFG